MDNNVISNPTQDSKKKTWIYIGIGCAGLLFICVVVGIGFGWWFFFSPAEVPEQVDIQISAPDRIAVGEIDTILVHIENLASEPQMFDSIDLDLSYIEGIAITSVNPAYEELERLEMFGFESFYFFYPLSSRESIEISFTIEGLIPGQYFGLISVCINESNVCLDIEQSIIVFE